MYQDNKKALSIIFITVLIDLLGIGIIIPIMGPLFLKSTELFAVTVDDATRTRLFGLMIALFSIFQFISGPLLGGLSDVHGRKKVLFGSLFLTLAGYILLAYGIYTYNLWLLFAGRALAGMAAGNLSVVYSAIADISEPQEKAKNFGMVGMAFGLGFIMGPVIGGVLADTNLISWFSPSLPIIFAAFLSLLNIVLVAFYFPETLQDKRTDKKKTSVWSAFANIKKVFASENLRTIFLIIFLYFFGFTMFTQFYQVFLIKKFQFGQARIGYLFGYIGIWGVFTQGVLVRLVSKRFTPAQVLSVTLPALAMSYLLYLLPEASWQLLICVPFYAIAQGMSMPNLNAIVSNNASASMQGETMGMQQSVQSVAQMITPLIGAWMVSQSYYAPMYVGCIVCMIAWGLLYLHKKERIKLL